MCGVHGMLTDDHRRVVPMVEACDHRGPDEAAVVASGPYQLGHNLLEIRTTNTQHAYQPRREGSGTLAYNGEIYDFGTLPTPKTPGDTAKLAAMLARYGPKALAAVDGMYALAWHDRDRHTLLLARDPLGAKPLYYTAENPLTFSSELRGLKAAGVPWRLDPIGLRLYLQFGYIPGPRTLIRGVRKLVPGECLLYNDDGTLRNAWNLAKPVAETVFDAQVYRDKLVETVRCCLVSERPAGLYLSGGLDSCSVLWAMRELGVHPDTLTMRFTAAKTKQVLLDGDCDIAARFAAACGTKHTEMVFTEADYLAHLHDSFSCDEPISRKGMPAYLAAHIKAKELGWVVVFTGDGGDELLGGYGRHVRLVDDRYEESRMSGDAVDRWLHLNSHGGAEKAWFSEEARAFDVAGYLRSWLPSVLIGGDVLRDELALEGVCHLAEDFLIRADKLGMSQSLECRFPLLHEPFRSYALGLPSNIKTDVRTRPEVRRDKWCAREAMRGFLPDEVVDKPKSGWGPPTGAWMDGKQNLTGPLGDAFRAHLQAGRLPVVDAVIDVERVKGRIKVALALFHLMLWAERVGLEA